MYGNDAEFNIFCNNLFENFSERYVEKEYDNRYLVYYPSGWNLSNGAWALWVMPVPDKIILQLQNHWAITLTWQTIRFLMQGFNNNFDNLSQLHYYWFFSFFVQFRIRRIWCQYPSYSTSTQWQCCYWAGGRNTLPNVPKLSPEPPGNAPKGADDEKMEHTTRGQFSMNTIFMHIRSQISTHQCFFPGFKEMMCQWIQEKALGRRQHNVVTKWFHVPIKHDLLENPLAKFLAMNKCS